MANKVLPTFNPGDGRGYAKVIKMVKSPKSGAYTFKQQMISTDEVKAYFKK